MKRIRILLACVLLASAGSVQAQATLHVPSNYPTIQAAINAAANGDTVLVAPGTYRENINFSGKAITVASEAGPDATIIDGGAAAAVVTFRSAEGASSVLRGFTVTNGRPGVDTQGISSEGGIAINHASPTVVGNVVANNGACEGAGINVNFGSPVIQGNTIVNNKQYGCSGGNGGGGISVGGVSSVQILENVIASNSMPGSGIGGGGIALNAGGTPTIRGNVIVANDAGFKYGGGIAMVNGSSPLIVQNVIAGNHALNGGGVGWLLPAGAVPVLINNTIAENDAAMGSGVYAVALGAQSQLVNNTIVAKAGQTAVFCDNFNNPSVPFFGFNNVSAPSGQLYAGICSDHTGLNSNISSDPLFVDATNGNYRLQPGSPSIDAGNNAAAQLPPRDPDGNARILDGDGNGAAVIDVGAFERTAMLSPGSRGFGAVVVGAAPSSQTFTISNPGATPLVISSIAIADHPVGAPSSSAYSVTMGGPNTCTTLAPTLAPGTSCTVVVTFAAPAAPGFKRAVLTVVSNAAESPTSAALEARVFPDTAISSSPAPLTNSNAANFSFTSNVAGSTFECMLDTDFVFTVCSSPKSYTGVADGQRTFQVRAAAPFGDADPTPATYTWTVDTIPPRVSVDTGPSGVVMSTSAAFTFSSNEQAVTYQCQLDGAGFAACASPLSYTSLAQGAHSLDLRPIDAAGNVGSLVALLWTVDTIPPDTAITAGPSGTQSATSAVFAFTATEPGTFQCRLDGAAYAGCFSPTGYNGLALGSHTFDVFATDLAGNVDATPASRTWSIAPPLFRNLRATLNGAQIVPSLVTLASGKAALVYDETSRLLSWNITFAGIATGVIGAHFYGPAHAGANGGIQLDVGAFGLASPMNGSAVLSAQQGADLLAGLWYLAIETSGFPGGEIRGQLGVSVKAADFNGDERADIFWLNTATTQTYVWQMNGIGIASSGSPSSTGDVNWKVAGIGDFDGDGKADVLYRHAVNGATVVWLMNGTTIAGSGSPGTVADLGWQVQGVGDFDGDGKADILWMHTDGRVQIWFMNGTTVSSTPTVTNLGAGSGWSVQGIGDFDGDGKADVLWRHTDGTMLIWLMNATIASLGSPANVGPTTATGWLVQGVGDFDGDGKADILWRNDDLGGIIYVWFMNGAAISSASAVTGVGTVTGGGWVVKGIGDYDGDGKADVFWKNDTALGGITYVWLMNGASISTANAVTGVPDINWEVQNPK